MSGVGSSGMELLLVSDQRGPQPARSGVSPPEIPRHAPFVTVPLTMLARQIAECPGQVQRTPRLGCQPSRPQASLQPHLAPHGWTPPLLMHAPRRIPAFAGLRSCPVHNRACHLDLGRTAKGVSVLRDLGQNSPKVVWKRDRALLLLLDEFGPDPVGLRPPEVLRCDRPRGTCQPSVQIRAAVNEADETAERAATASASSSRCSCPRRAVRASGISGTGARRTTGTRRPGSHPLRSSRAHNAL